jgi:hypothetical protein
VQKKGRFRDVYGLHLSYKEQRQFVSLIITLIEEEIPMNDGATVWYIPDAYLPSTGQGEMYEGHESVCVVNPSLETAVLTFTFYFENTPPVENIVYRLDGQRCSHIGMHRCKIWGGYEIPRDVPYGMKIESSVPVVLQYSRLDVAQPNYTLMTTIPFFKY